MKTSLVALLLAISALPAVAADPEHLDLTGVTAISITGDASAIKLTTADDAAYEATLNVRPAGWFSRWSWGWPGGWSGGWFAGCGSAGRMRVESGTLHVTVDASSWMDDCVVELTANLPRASSVAIEQAAAEISLEGDFSTVSLDSKAADFTLRGHADALKLKGDALRSDVTFEEVRNNETIAIAAPLLDMRLSFVSGTTVSYNVTAAASLVDSALANTVGAKPAIDIKAGYVRARID